MIDRGIDTQTRPGYLNIADDGMYAEANGIQVTFKEGTLTVDQHEGFGYEVHGVIPENCRVVVMPGRIVVDGRHVRRLTDLGPARSGFAGAVFIPVAEVAGRDMIVAYLARSGFNIEH